MARTPKEQGEILKNEQVLKMKYEENDKITKKFMREMNEMKSKMMDDYADTTKTADVKHGKKNVPVRTSEFNTFLRIVDNGDTVEEHRTVSSREITVKNYVMQREIDRLNGELAKTHDACDRLEQENQKLTEENGRYAGQVAALKEKIRKRDGEIETLTGTLRTREAEVSRLSKDVGTVERKFQHERVVHEKQRSIMARSSDENKQLRETVRRLETLHREMEEKHAKTLSMNDDALAKCSREKDALVVGFRKQLELIDSLKRQTVRAKLQDEINIIENEFGKFLEGN